MTKKLAIVEVEIEYDLRFNATFEDVVKDVMENFGWGCASSEGYRWDRRKVLSVKKKE